MGTFPDGKAARAWCYSLTSIKDPGYEYMELYLHSPYIFMAWYLIMHSKNFTL
jgi:hypothetical protein